MKKIYFFLTVIFLSCFIISCEPENTTENVQNDNRQTENDEDDNTPVDPKEGLDEEIEAQILQAYLEKLQSEGENADLTINDVYIEKYYGSYCPAYLFPDRIEEQWDFLMTDYRDPQNQTVVAVKAGVKGMDSGTYPRDVIINTPNDVWRSMIRYYDNCNILIWDKGHLYDMEKDTRTRALDYLLANMDARKIINRHNGLDFETDTMIREDIGKFIYTKMVAEGYATIRMVYLGTYNGYTALTLLNGAVLMALYSKYVDGVGFYFYNSPIRIIAWKEREIYQLEDLFEQGLITHEDLVEMAYFHNTGTGGN